MNAMSRAQPRNVCPPPPSPVKRDGQAWARVISERVALWESVTNTSIVCDVQITDGPQLHMPGRGVWKHDSLPGKLPPLERTSRDCLLIRFSTFSFKTPDRPSFSSSTRASSTRKKFAAFDPPRRFRGVSDSCSVTRSLPAGALQHSSKLKICGDPHVPMQPTPGGAVRRREGRCVHFGCCGGVLLPCPHPPSSLKTSGVFRPK